MAEGRRERIKEKVRRVGIEGLAPHEVLEYLLYPFQKRKDTGNLGRELLKRFGTLENVFNATEQELLEVPNMPIDAALTFTQLFSLQKVCAMQIIKSCTLDLSKPKIAGEFCHLLLSHLAVERVIVLALDNNFGLINYKVIANGDRVHASLSINEICCFAQDQRASNLIISHNHPISTTHPSVQDKSITEEISERLNVINIKLHDHIIVNKSGWRSMRFNKEM